MFLQKLKQHQRHVKRQRSSTQIKRNKTFTRCVNLWNALSEFQQISWSTYATGSQTNYNAFMSLNLIRGFNDLPLLPIPDREV